MKYLLLLFFSYSIYASDWFIHQNPISRAHEQLLNGQTAKSYKSMIEAWKETTTETQKNNLAELLTLAISEDCGHSIDPVALPDWLKGIVLRRESIQTTNRIYHKFSIIGHSNTELTHLTFSKWGKKPYSLIQVPMESQFDFKYQVKNVDAPFTSNLFKLSIRNKNNQIWQKWLMIYENEYTQKIMWRTDRTWRLNFNKGLIKNCPKPFMTIHLFQKTKNSETPIWSEIYENILPVNLPQFNVPEGEYLVTVSIFTRRWQGSILYEDVQRINRIIHLPLEQY